MPELTPDRPAPTASQASYGQILRSSSIIGGAAGINLLLGMVRMKFAAVLIGTAGVGLVGVYQSLQAVAGTLAGLGIQQSAVRDIAAAVGRDDALAIGRTVVALRRMCWLTGVLGALALVALASPLSRYTFGTDSYALDIALLAPTIFLTRIQGGQAAILQGMRRIGDLARLTLIGAAGGSLGAVLFYAWLGLRGIIPALLFMAVVQGVATWLYARRLVIPPIRMPWRETLGNAHGMLRLGLAFMGSGVLAAAVAYLTRAWITQQQDLMAVGLFTAAFSLSGMFINFILGAMGADYFPRLTAVAHDKEAMRRLVNEQTEIGLLLAIPGLLATLTLAPWLIRGFFSTEFLPAAGLLQWFILGCLGQVIAWPLGYIMLALARSRWFLATETSFHLLHLGMIWIALAFIGLEGVAMAFFVLYLLYAIVLYALAWRLIGFTWSPATRRLLTLFLPLVALAFLCGRFLPLAQATAVGMLLTAAAALFCLRALAQRVGQEHWAVKKSLRIPGLRRLCGFQPRYSDGGKPE
ncbi:MAG: O-antigen translocase [Halioglobus sp.]